ncbi:OB-fold domain-containing protein [Mycolicibacterium sp. 050232]|uniref:Zn-ribbon domain-containing OB-fold protein n=1 Tax=Mycolicibacterium sp. 050232 TaxID=3113982 RepID=UPI002E28DE52|nr:OB-fold domain-containing protein [Mycolicibacterium sp. 050232]MED5810836.1 OB-fold domain-containing protein [Mycolicibacterium sp. 050232]
MAQHRARDVNSQRARHCRPVHLRRRAGSPVTPPVPGRPAPELSELNRPYWTSGADGAFRMQRCPGCERVVHPPALRCQYDHAAPEWITLSGKGIVESWTVNHHAFFPGLPAPYVIAFVNPVEDIRARVLTNLVGVAPDDVHAGMAVRVVFERADTDDSEQAVYLPMFTPEAP